MNPDYPAPRLAPPQPPLPARQLAAPDQTWLPAFGAVEVCARIAPGHAVVVGWTLSTDGERTQVEFPTSPGGNLPSKITLHPRPDLPMTYRKRLDQLQMPPESRASGFVAIVALPRADDELVVRWVLPEGYSGTYNVPVAEEADSVLWAWQRLLAQATSLLEPALRLDLSPLSLHSLGDHFGAAPGQATITLDMVVTTGDTGLLIAGVAFHRGTGDHPRLLTIDRSGTLTDISAQTTWTARHSIWAGLSPPQRPPHKDIGFQVRVSGPQAYRPGAPVRLAAIWPNQFAFAVADGMAQPASDERRQEIDTLLSHLELPQANLGHLLDHFFGPTIRQFWRGRAATPQNLTEVNFGTVPVSPDYSVVVPIYRRWDFIEIQIQRFVEDLDFANAELIYMIDDPTIYDAVVAYWHARYEAYQLPFRLLYSHRNLGYAAANNLAVERAKARWLVLLNSDVKPIEHGWIGALKREYLSCESPGVIGARLLFEDGTLQHDGMEFVAAPAWAGLHLNHHPGKGRQIDNGETATIRRVPAVTGACMFMERDRFLSVGGFHDEYVRGDFEDSDLCLKMLAQGWKSYCASGVSLHHLERQSIGATPRSGVQLTIYNAWLHHQRWKNLSDPLTPGAPAQ